MLMRAAAAAFATTLAFAGAAGAVDLRNDTTKEVKVQLTQPGAKPDEVTLQAGETKEDVCAMCTVTVEGMEPMSAVGLDMIVIGDSELKKIEN
ncbi:MAG: hypothetical protein ACK4QW_06125 [Alphaproteobacteria bacterium]